MIDKENATMKWKYQGHEFDHTAMLLCNTATKYYIWGTANIAKNLISLCGKEIEIIGAVDSNTARQGDTIANLAIEDPEVLNPASGYVVLVTTSAFNEIKPRLISKGFKENINFFDYFVFTQIYQLYKHDKLYSRRLDIALTERCTLKCKKCNMFMPYFKDPSDLDKEDVLKQIDQYFSMVEYLESFNLLGGEPLLYTHLADIIAYTGEKYRANIEHFKIFTNGMLLPGEKLLELFHKYSVELQISDYTESVSYQNRLQELKYLLKKANVSYYVVKSSLWGDFGFPDNCNSITDSQLISFFDACRASFRGLYKNRVYFCHLETSAIRAGLYEDNSNDYFNLEDELKDKKKRFLEFDLGYNREGAISFCRVCRGCDTVNSLTVKAAEQMEVGNV